MGYVFLCLVVLFIGISMCSKNTKPAEVLTENVVKAQLKWSKILCVCGVILLAAGIWMMTDETCRNYGAETIFFLVLMLFTISWYLHSNAKDKVEDVKSIGIDIEIFKSNTAFNIGAFGIIIILAILYICLW
jgi:solute:Na+ symporter, SSS family